MAWPMGEDSNPNYDIIASAEISKDLAILVYAT